MGPYCKFCGTRCFVPTTEADNMTVDLKATCEEGKAFDEAKEQEKMKEKPTSYFLRVEKLNGYLAWEHGFSTPEDAYTFMVENYPDCDNYAINEEEENDRD